MKANNFERHSPPVDYYKILASIQWNDNKPKYPGPGHNMRMWDMQAAMQAIMKGKDLTDILPTGEKCLTCGALNKPDGGNLLTCSRCNVAAYCSVDCQRQDWKRHKKEECNQPKSDS